MIAVAGWAVVLAIFSALLAAPLLLGTWLALQRQEERVGLLWLGALTALLLGALALATLTLVLLLF